MITVNFCFTDKALKFKIFKGISNQILKNNIQTGCVSDKPRLKSIEFGTEDCPYDQNFKTVSSTTAGSFKQNL